MSTEIYKAGPETMKLMVELIHKYHPELSLIEDQIVVLFRDKAKKTPDEREVPCTVSKVSPRLKILTDKKFDYKFQIEIPTPLWNMWDDPTRAAVLNHCLCAMGIKENEESGEIKTFIKPPDIAFYADELNTTAEHYPLSDDQTYLDLERMVEAKLEAANEPSMFVVKPDQDAKQPRKPPTKAKGKGSKKTPPKPDDFIEDLENLDDIQESN